MREIKFKIWDKENNRMLKDVTTWTDDFTDDLNRTIEYLQTMASEPVVLMQFTGLLDKNGKEIYEGDLFNCIYHRDGCTHHVFEVVYNTQNTSFGLKIYGEKCHQKQVMQYVYDVARYPCIGNIYENPELLK